LYLLKRCFIAAHGVNLHLRDFSLTLPALNLLDGGVIGQRVLLRQFYAAKTHRNVRVYKCHD
jgi:hypothetical protein